MKVGTTAWHCEDSKGLQRNREPQKDSELSELHHCQETMGIHVNTLVKSCNDGHGLIKKCLWLQFDPK